MKPEIRKLWVDSLRSGRFKKCMRVCKRDDRYCVLGVLIALYNECHKRQICMNGLTYLPKKVQRWAGIGSAFPIISGSELKYSGEYISVLNDGCGDREPKPLGFKKLAKLIEQYDCE